MRAAVERAAALLIRCFPAWKFGQRSLPKHSLRDSRHADVGSSSAHLGSSVASGELSPRFQQRSGPHESNRGRRCSRRREPLLRQSRLRGVSCHQQPRCNCGAGL